MKRAAFCCIGILMGLVLTPSPVTAQRFRVALSLTDASGNVTTELAGSLRRLGDVDVVTEEEPYDYLLEGVVLCTPNKTRCDAFAASLRFSQPLNVQSVAWTIALFVRRAGPLTQVQDTALATTLGQLTQDYSKTGGSWVVIWLRGAVDSEASDFVAELDQNCFERERIERRVIALAQQRDTIASRALAAKLFRDPSAKSALC